DGVTTILVPGGRISLASVASSGVIESDYSRRGNDPLVRSFLSLGRIAIDHGSQILGNRTGDKRGGGGARLVIRCGQFLASNLTSIGSRIVDQFSGQGIDISASQSIVIRDSQIDGRTASAVTGTAGAIIIGA